ncbi:hypothetical protein RJ639_000795 [Escallonia herrerae]|uniref:Transposase (putative) gypsy type domain-containing protein n=1 Tax=Escallonia herrerae TaxID=1293975 RepID=A0AA89BN35_9ASTE|nr:hypothetical protein RJ639_000795 [Escallonia herrerae]
MAMCFILLWNTGFSQMYVVPTLSHRMRGMAFKGKRSSRNKGGAVEPTIDEGAEDKGGAGAEVDSNEGVAREIVVSRDRMAAEMAKYSGPRPCRILTMSCTFVMAAPAVASSSAMEQMSLSEGAVEMAEKIMTMHEHGDLCFPGCEIVTASKLDGQLRGRIKLHDSGIASGIVGVDNRGVGGHYLRKAVGKRGSSEEEMLCDQRERGVRAPYRERDAAGTRKLLDTFVCKTEESIRRSNALEQDEIGALSGHSSYQFSHDAIWKPGRMMEVGNFVSNGMVLIYRRFQDLKKREQKKLEEIRCGKSHFTFAAKITLLGQSVRTGFCSAVVTQLGQSVQTGFCSASVILLMQSVRTGFCLGMNLFGQDHFVWAECSDGILLGQNSARPWSLSLGRFGTSSNFTSEVRTLNPQLPPPSFSQPLPPSSSQPPQPSTSQLPHSLSGKNALGDVKDQAEDKANPKPWYTADEKSGKISAKDLQELIQEYPLPEGWYACLPGLQEPANYGTKFETGIYEEQVKSGYRLPLHPFALRFFEHYHMAPGQLVPNGWRKLVGLIYLVQTSGYKSNATDFMSLFQNRFRQRSRQLPRMGGPKSNKGWHSKYFFVGRLDKGKLPFDRDWNPYCKDFENPGKPIPNNLTKHILGHIKLRGGLSIDEPLSEEQLVWAKIIPPKPIPAGLLIPPPPPAILSVSSAETVPLGRWLAEVENRHKEAFLAFSRKLRGSEKRSSQMYASGSEMLSCFEMARQVAAEEAHQKREAIKEAQEATRRAEELSKQEADHLAQILTLEKRLERAKKRAAEEVTKARDQGIHDFLDGNAGDKWLKKQTEDGLEIYELGFARAKEMFAERFPDIPLDDFILPAVVSPSGETAMPSEAGDAAASHLPGEGPFGDAPEP